MANEYIVGQIAVLKDVITNPVSGVPVDDATDVVTVYKPDGTSALPAVTPGVTNSGQYTAQVTFDQAGWWEYVWRSTGAGAGAGRSRVYVSPVP